MQGYGSKSIYAVGGVAAPLITSFSDDFNRPQTTYGFDSTQYISGPQPSPIEATGMSVFLNNIQEAVFRASSVATNMRRSFVFWPIPILPNVQGDQFAECVLGTTNSVTGVGIIVCGIFVLCGWQTAVPQYSEYAMMWQGPDGSATQNRWLLRRGELTAGSGFTETIIANGATGSLVAGDTIRIEARPQVGQTDLDLFVNGTPVHSHSDVSAGRSRIGAPGFGRCQWVSGPAPGNRDFSFASFNCGIL